MIPDAQQLKAPPRFAVAILEAFNPSTIYPARMRIVTLDR